MDSSSGSFPEHFVEGNSGRIISLVGGKIPELTKWLTTRVYRNDPDSMNVVAAIFQKALGCKKARMIQLETEPRIFRGFSKMGVFLGVYGKNRIGFCCFYTDSCNFRKIPIATIKSISCE